MMSRVSTEWQGISILADQYNSVKGLKSHAEKDQLIIESSLILSRATDDPSVFGFVAYAKKMNSWCAATKYKENSILRLAKTIEKLDGIESVYFFKGHPDKEIELAITGDRHQLDLYDDIVDILMEFEDDNQLLTSFIFLTPEEFATSGLSNQVIDPYC